jgi:hypothetical protein
VSQDEWDSVRRERLVKNELAFRSYNNRRVGLEREAAGERQADDEVVPFVCECGNGDCITALSVTVGEYEQAHSAPNRFIVKPGHVYPDVEHVAEQHGHYWIVEKQIGEMPSPESHASL